MKIRVTFISILADWVGVPEAVIELPTGAIYEDLLAVIGRRYRRNMPPQLWDERNKRFSHPVIAFKNDVLMENCDTQLVKGDHLRFLAGMGGG